MGILDLFRKKKTANNPFKSLLDKLFPNGDVDTLAGASEVSRISGNKIPIQEAKSIFIKSLVIALSGEFSPDRLKEHLKPYALHYFNDEQISQFYNYITVLGMARMMSNKAVSDVKCNNGDYTW